MAKKVTFLGGNKQQAIRAFVDHFGDDFQEVGEEEYQGPLHLKVYGDGQAPELNGEFDLVVEQDFKVGIRGSDLVLWRGATTPSGVTNLNLTSLKVGKI